MGKAGPQNDENVGGWHDWVQLAIAGRVRVCCSLPPQQQGFINEGSKEPASNASQGRRFKRVDIPRKKIADSKCESVADGFV
jgi:hypothetical protein